MYYTLAELLIDARNSKGLSLSQVEKMTRIRAEYIDALEQARYEDLPADVYIRGILKNYSHFLGLEYDEVVRLYRKDGVLAGISQEDMKQAPPSERKSKVVLLGKLALGAITVVGFGIIFWYLFSQYRILKAPPELLIEQPSQEYTTTTSPDMTLSGRTELSAKLYLNDQEVSLSEDGSFKLPFQLQPGDNIIEFRAQSLKNDKETTVTKTVVYEPVIGPEIPPSESESTEQDTSPIPEI